MIRNKGFSLIELLVVMAVLAILSGIVFSMAGNTRQKNGKAATPLAKAHDTECISNIRSVRQSIAVFQVGETENHFPPDLASLKLPKEVTHCAVGKQEYAYDPQTGEVKCTYPSHEKY